MSQIPVDATPAAIAALLDGLQDPASHPGIVAGLGELSVQDAAPFSALLHAAIGLENRAMARKVVQGLLSARPEWVNDEAGQSDRMRPCTPVVAAIRARDLDMFDLLVAHGAAPRRRSKGKQNALRQNALDVAVEVSGNHRIQRAYVEAVLDAAPFPDQDKHVALVMAASRLNLGAVRALLADNAPLRVWKTGHGRVATVESALILACLQGPLEAIVDEILKKADEDYLNAGWTQHQGQSAIHAAADSGNLAVLVRLIQAGAWLNPPPGLGLDRACTPLMAAARAGSPDAIQALLDAGARAGWVDENGFNAIHHLANPDDDFPDDVMGPGHLRALDILIAAGEDPFALDGQGRTPLDLARASGCQSLAAALMGLHLARGLPAPSLPARQARM